MNAGGVAIVQMTSPLICGVPLLLIDLYQFLATLKQNLFLILRVFLKTKTKKQNKIIYFAIISSLEETPN